MRASETQTPATATAPTGHTQPAPAAPTQACANSRPGACWRRPQSAPAAPTHACAGAWCLPGFIRPNSAGPRRPTVCGLLGQCTLMMSAVDRRRSKSPRVLLEVVPTTCTPVTDGRVPSWLLHQHSPRRQGVPARPTAAERSASVGAAAVLACITLNQCSCTRTCMPRPRAAAARPPPTLPCPTMPSVLPCSSVPIGSPITPAACQPWRGNHSWWQARERVRARHAKQTRGKPAEWRRSCHRRCGAASPAWNLRCASATFRASMSIIITAASATDWLL